MREATTPVEKRNIGHGRRPGLSAPPAADHGGDPYAVALDAGAGGAGGNVAYRTQIDPSATDPGGYVGGTANLGAALATQKLTRSELPNVDQSKIKLVGEQR